MTVVSGGEPLYHPQVFEIARALRENGINSYLSSNGWPITPKTIEKIRDNFSYVGISIDGTPDIHDKFRGKKGSFERALRAIELCLEAKIRVGLRFTLARSTFDSLPFIFELIEKYPIPKLYISHVVYAGRAESSQRLTDEQRKKAIQLILDKAFQYVESNQPIKIVTGNNESDAVWLWQEFSRRYPKYSEQMWLRLANWGGNRAGIDLLNITPEGELRPDPFFPTSLGNVKSSPLQSVWSGELSPEKRALLKKLRETPRKLSGRCQNCQYLPICNGSSRARAYALYGDLFAEDPDCSIPKEFPLEEQRAVPLTSVN